MPTWSWPGSIAPPMEQITSILSRRQEILPAGPYEADEVSIFELSVALERLTQSRSRAVNTAVTVLQAQATLAARLAFHCLNTNHE